MSLLAGLLIGLSVGLTMGLHSGLRIGLRMGNYSGPDNNIFSIGYGALQIAYSDKKTFEKLVKEVAMYGRKSNTKVVFDTARVYGDCEQMLGGILEANPELRQYLFIVVKIGIAFDTDHPHYLKKSDLESMAHESLKRLRLPKVDCIMLHRLPENHPDFDEALSTLIGFRDTLCDTIGLSEVSGKTIQVADIDCIEIAYSPFVRTADYNSVMELAKKKNCMILTYTSIARGLLNETVLNFFNENREFKTEFDGLTTDEFQNKVFELLFVSQSEQSIGYYDPDVLKNNIRIIANFIYYCKDHQWDPSQVCLAYAVKCGCIPIPGTTKVENLKKNMDAPTVSITDDNITEINAITAGFKGDPNPTSLSYLNSV